MAPEALHEVKSNPIQLYGLGWLGLDSSRLAATKPELFREMLGRVDELQKTVYSPFRGAKDPGACHKAKKEYHGRWSRDGKGFVPGPRGFWGPWLEEDEVLMV